VQADLSTRYFDGARFNGSTDADKAFGILATFGEFVTPRLRSAPRA